MENHHGPYTRLRPASKPIFPRLKILDIFHQHSTSTPSAADIYRSLISEHSRIGLATVYRVITQLEDAGLLKRTQLDSHSTVYELNDKGHHDYLVCRHCGRIQESSDTAMAQRIRKIAWDSGWALESYSLVLTAAAAAARTRPSIGAPE